jgi:hypothetical protein
MEHEFKVGDYFTSKYDSAIIKKGQIVGEHHDRVSWIIQIIEYNDGRLAYGDMLTVRFKSSMNNLYLGAPEFFEIGKSYKYEYKSSPSFKVLEVYYNDNPQHEYASKQALAITTFPTGESSMTILDLDAYKSVEEV